MISKSISGINDSFHSTPEDNQSFGGLKFTYEAQPNSYATPTITPLPDIKESPPSSPGSEAGSKKRTTNDTKDFKIFQQKGVHTALLGNQLNPTSSVAQKMTDQLYMELEAHSVYTTSSMDSATPLIGPVFPGKPRSNTTSTPQGPSLSSMLGGTAQPSATGNTPQSLEQLLERQWEQGSQFLMEQAQHFDSKSHTSSSLRRPSHQINPIPVASLLSCLHQLRTENVRLEEHVNNLVARRDHLLAVNARLAIPLNPIPAESRGQGSCILTFPQDQSHSAIISQCFSAIQQFTSEWTD